MSGLGAWASRLQTATWWGVPFVVRQSQIRRGRRVAVHEYPNRDTVWVEDLGRGVRTFAFSGFIAGDLVFIKRALMALAVERPGPGLLVHPSIGAVFATLQDFSASERWEQGGVVELEFSFIETPPQSELLQAALLAGTVLIAAVGLAAKLAASNDYNRSATAAIKNTALAAAAAAATTAAFAKAAVIPVADPSRLVGAVRGVGAITGNRERIVFGRYSSGALSAPPVLDDPIPQSIVGPARGRAATTALLANSTTRGATLAAAITTVTASSTVDPDAIYAITEAVRAAANDPADQVRLLAPLATFAPPAMLAPPIVVASTNLIPDSQGLSALIGNGQSVITLAPSDAPAPPFNGAKVARAVMSAGGSMVAGFLPQAGHVAGAHYAISISVYIPVGQTLTALTFRAESNASGSNVTLTPANLALQGQWQRISTTFTATAAGTCNLVLRANSAAGCTVYLACPDEEAGTVTTAYIPTSGAAASRAASGPAPLDSAVLAAQNAAAALCRRCALASLGYAAGDYQPNSYDDALAVLDAVTTALDAEILAAADGGDEDSYQALRELRTAVVQDLTDRATQLSRLTRITSASPMPALVLAQRLYGDASRSDDLIARVNVPHPAFMPLSFQGLSP